LKIKLYVSINDSGQNSGDIAPYDVHSPYTLHVLAVTQLLLAQSVLFENIFFFVQLKLKDTFYFSKGCKR